VQGIDKDKALVKILERPKILKDPQKRLRGFNAKEKSTT